MSEEQGKELERLRADLEAMDRVQGLWVFSDDFRDEFHMHKDKFSKKIAALEAESDPWRRARSAVEYFRGFGDHKQAEHDVVAYVDYLTAELAAKDQRIAELEAEIKAWKEAAAVLTVESEMINTPERLSDRIVELCGVKTPANDVYVADIDILSDEQVDSELRRRGIDVTNAFQRIREELEKSKSQPLFEGVGGDMDAEAIRTAEEAIPLHIRNGGIKVKAVAEYALMLRFDNARLQSELKIVQDELFAIRRHDEPRPVADMQPPFEGPIESIDPVLDPARVLATAAELGWGPTVYAEMTLLRNAKPYKLKGAGE